MRLLKRKSSFAAACNGCKSNEYIYIVVGIFVCGGSDGAVQSSFEYLDLYNKEWRTLPPMSGKREELGLTIGPDNKVYAVGGFTGQKYILYIYFIYIYSPLDAHRQ